MGDITIVGTGWTEDQLTLRAAEALKGGAAVILHTERCGCADWLKKQGLAFESLDALYDACDDFDEHAAAAAEAVLRRAESGDVVYGVSDVRDRSVQLLVRKGPARISVVAGPPAEGALLALARGETRCVEASDWEAFHVTARENCLIRELDSRELAAEVKLKLMSVYPEECEIWLLTGDAPPVSMPLYALDRAGAYDHRTCALIPAAREITALERYDFEHLNEIMRTLCGPGGCPWDRAQTHASLRTCMLEEAYEVIDAIDEEDTDHLYDELGDVLLQVAIHAELARRHGEFDISDVTTAICEKMIHRHTHIFGKDSAQSAEQVMDLWSRNKMAERGLKTHSEALRSVTRTLPATLRAVKVLKRSADAGLCDHRAQDVARRFANRINALGNEGGNGEAVLGELLMDIAGLARLMGIDPEIALNGAVNRFIDRFEALEGELLQKDVKLAALGSEKLREYWDLVKL
ncbi:MAG: nucleoside triphosphate pyrophosphohydrolase [Clostridia bacterium]|nr:nucleoside triphosphate pyrophosphohydrolase [Clostridia bacterium]